MKTIDCVLAGVLACLIGLLGWVASAPLPVRATDQPVPADGRPDLVQNGSLEDGPSTPGALPTGWQTDSFAHASTFTWETGGAPLGSRSVKITATALDDTRWIQTFAVQPNTSYLVSGFLKTQAVAHTSAQSSDPGATITFLDHWANDYHTRPLYGDNDWTYVQFTFNTREHTEMTMALRIGGYGGMTTGTAWFDDVRMTPIYASDPHPSWKFLVLIYKDTDFTYKDAASKSHHLTGSMTAEELTKSAEFARNFVEIDVPALSSGNMTPTITIRYPNHALTKLSSIDGGWHPFPEDVAADLDPAFDSVIVIWDPSLWDSVLGRETYIGAWGGLAHWRGAGQTYLAINVECTYIYGHRNFFRHEWGHSLLFYYEAAGTAPQPSVDNHMNLTDKLYVHCPTGAMYVFEDETLDHLIPNSIYNLQSGFTHDYYSGTAALPSDPTTCLGINPMAWAVGGPVSKPARPAEAPVTLRYFLPLLRR